MKAVTLWQPFASYVVDGLKRYETRSWYCGHKGLLAIHAAKRPAVRGFDLPELGYEAPLGAILGVAVMDACIPTVDWYEMRETLTDEERAVGDFSPGRYAWRFPEAFKLDEPIPYSGAQGIWTVEDPAVNLVLNRLVPDALYEVWGPEAMRQEGRHDASA